jgi:hypothetical protein
MELIEELILLLKFNRSIPSWDMAEKYGLFCIFASCKVPSMPTISMFFGIIIRMYYAPKEHNPPHIHVYYQDF